MEELEEVELGTLLKAENILEKREKPKKKMIDLKRVKRSRNYPEECSATVKPKKERFKEKKNTRDPRFDDLSGDLDVKSFRSKYDFVEKETEQYLDKLDTYNKNRKKGELSDEQMELLKGQKNFTKGWITHLKRKRRREELSKDYSKTEIDGKLREEFGVNKKKEKSRKMKGIKREEGRSRKMNQM